MPRLELYPFRFLDPVTGKWRRARYRATREELEQRYGAGRYEITGSPEIRDVDPEARYFSPFANPAVSGSIGNLGPIMAVVRRVTREDARRAIVGVAT